MTERLRPADVKSPVPPIDLPDLIGRIKGGDATAYLPLDEHLRPIFDRFFGRRLPQERDDLTQTTLMRVYEGLPNFDPAIGSGDLVAVFRRWSFRIARSTLNMAYRERMASKTTGMTEDVERTLVDPLVHRPTAPTLVMEDVIPEIESRLAEVLSPRELEVMRLRMIGKNRPEVAAELGKDLDYVRSVSSRARRKLEDEILLPAGFKHVSEYDRGKTTLHAAASRGDLQAIKFCGRWYTTDAWVSQYAPRQKAVDSALLAEGYVLLNRVAKHDEYGTIQGSQHRHLITKKDGFMYIKPEQLDEFRRYRRKTNKRFQPPTPAHIPLASLTATQYEYQLLLYDVKAGKLPAVRHKTWWFVLPEDYEKYKATGGERETLALPVKRDLRSSANIHGNKRIIFDAVIPSDIQIGKQADFEKWFFSVAKAATAHKLPYKDRSPLANAEDITDRACSELDLWLQSAGVSLTTIERNFIRTRITGASLKDTARVLGITESSIRLTENVKVRHYLRKNLFEPAGIVRLSSFKDQQLAIAAIYGRIDAVWFLGYWYTTQERLDEYKARRFQKMLKDYLKDRSHEDQ